MGGETGKDAVSKKMGNVERRGGTSRLGVSLETHAEIVSKAEVKAKSYIVMICIIIYLQSKTKGE